MRRKPFRFVEATVRFETEGGLGEKLLSRCARDQIELEAVTPTATGFRGRVRARDYAALAKHARRCHCHVRVKERYGVMFWLAAYRRRAGLWQAQPLRHFCWPSASGLYGISPF